MVDASRLYHVVSVRRPQERTSKPSSVYDASRFYAGDGCGNEDYALVSFCSSTVGMIHGSEETNCWVGTPSSKSLETAAEKL